NGKPVQNNVLDPAWTDFSKRIYYSEYDISSMLINGNNCIGLKLGNGFYNPLPLKKWGRRNMRIDTSVGKPVFIAKLLIEYENGKIEEIVSDQSWNYAYGPLVKNSVYIGVTYNAEKEIPGWDKVGFDDESWHQAEIGKAPGGKLQKSFFQPVRITEEITPVDIYPTENGKYIVDMGENFTGTFKMKISGKKGDTITYRFGERIYDNGELNPMTSVIGQIKRKGMGGPGAPDVVWQTDSYIFKNEKETWFEPEFTYHTYRYMEIDGLDYQPQPSDIKGLFIHSDVPQKNHFSCSSKLLNQIQEATDRTFRANLVSVQSDCPAREKFGYGGDLNATVESFIYNYDMQNFYRKTIYDWLDAMNDSGFVDTAPFVGIKYCGISWESAFLITQYYLYLYYNDVGIIKELYDVNKKWMDKAERIHPEGLVNTGLSDHESLEPVPVQLTGTCHYLQCARIMQTFASVMGDTESEKKYGLLAEKLKSIVKAEFWDNQITDKINRQTLYSTLLYHKIIPENEIEAARDSLKVAVKNGPAGHFITGIFGTKYILETLSEYTSTKEVFDIVNSTEYPGWGHMIKRGATTIWETWKESDNTYSNCHPMFGSVTEWFYRWLGGIRPIDNEPGFKRFVVSPFIPDELDYVNCTYHSPFGEIISNWKKEGPDKVEFEIKIPEGSTALIDLQLSNHQILEIQKGNNIMETTPAGINTGKFDLGEGHYYLKLSSTK
ncbi:MAG: family 78 glycoside hydrolase catalytic domain, partial [Draconibacterium sp.]|nr:family 78 glycoside hydrolase catalytic domain [Draconibacterium sp.]